jgi:hypothetical protein
MPTASSNGPVAAGPIRHKTRLTAEFQTRSKASCQLKFNPRQSSSAIRYYVARWRGRCPRLIQSHRPVGFSSEPKRSDAGLTEAPAQHPSQGHFGRFPPQCAHSVDSSCSPCVLLSIPDILLTHVLTARSVSRAPLKLFDNFAILPPEIAKVRKVFVGLTHLSLSSHCCIPYRYIS